MPKLSTKVLLSHVSNNNVPIDIKKKSIKRKG